ncbi:MAG: RNA 2'-phosphotransferase [Bacteroidota bacterium]
MSGKSLKKISKMLSLVLRHAPEKIGLVLDEAGWADVGELIRKVNAKGFDITPTILKEVVETNDKQRFSFNEDGTRIRANQGHSININHGFVATEPPEILYHGTAVKSLESILANGIDKRKRHHVHLSADMETATRVGQRHGKVVILEVAAQKMQQAGHEFYLSENKVWLTDFVPTGFIQVSTEWKK